MGQFELPILDSTLAVQIGACHIKDMARPKRPRDTNQLAKLIVDAATDERKESQATGPVNEFARAAGLKGGKARAAKLTPAERSEIARKAARTRWKT